MALSKKRQAFVLEYLTCWNSSEAARRAGYKGKPNVVGPRLLANVSIQEEIRCRLDDMAMTADEVLIRLAQQARGDIGDFLEFHEGVREPFLDLQGAKGKGLLHLVKRLKYNAKGYPEIELYDAQAALVQLGRAHGIFTDKTEVVGLEDVLRSLPDEFGRAVRQALAELIRSR